MATLPEFDAFFEKYNPTGGGVEEWNMWCQAFVARCCKFSGNWKRDYRSARAARLASGPLNKDLSNVPVGAFGYWGWEPDDDVAIYVGGGIWMRGSRHVTTRFGGVSRNAGLGSFESFQRSAGLPWLGWSLTNGGNTVEVSTMYPDQRRTLNTIANIRTLPTRKSADVGNRKPNTIYTFEWYARGEKVGSGANADLWYGDKASPPKWSHSSSFENPNGTGGLRKWTPPVVPDPVPTPEPKPPVVEPEPEPKPTPTPDPIEPPPAPVEPTEPEPTPEPEIPAPTPAPNWGAAIVAFFAALAKIINKITGRKDTE